MSLVQIPVRVKATTPGGVPLEGARIVSTITKMEVDGGILVRQPIVGVTNASGYVDLAHWPNTRGLNGSRYKVQIWFNEAVIDSFFMTVPEADAGSWPVLAESIINAAAPPTVGAAEVVLAAAQAAVVAAQGYAAAAAAYRYTHTQSIASAIWTVPHNLHGRPSITVVDHLARQIYPDVTWVDDDIVQITHGSAITGAVYCS